MTKTLILVHPGSLMGSADMHLGQEKARQVRDDIFIEVSEHDGAFLVIDGSLSDELLREQNRVIEEALRSAEEGGHLALRVWGDDDGADPHDFWQKYPRNSKGLSVFGNQMMAASELAAALPPGEIILTGAWLDDDYGTGCVRAVEKELRTALGADALISISKTAARMPAANPTPEASSSALLGPTP